MDWRRTLERNWIYMAVAALLSLLLWVGVSANTLSQRFITTELVVINGDLRFVQTGQEPDVETVEVQFAGREGAMLSLLVSRPQIMIVLDSIADPVIEVELNPRMVTGRGGRELGDVQPVSVRPNRLRLLFQPRARKVVPVVPRAILSFADSHMMADSVRVRPGAVAIEGPENEVNAIDSLHTQPINRQRLSGSFDVEVPIALPVGAPHVSLSASSVRVAVSVEARVERVFPGVPVTAEGTELVGARLEPSLVDITMTGPRGAVEAIRPESLTPTVRVGPDHDLSLPLAIELEPHSPFVTVELEPDSAFVIAPGGTR